MNFRNWNSININTIILSLTILYNFNKTVNSYWYYHKKQHKTYDFYIAKIKSYNFANIINLLYIAVYRNQLFLFFSTTIAFWNWFIWFFGVALIINIFLIIEKFFQKHTYFWWSELSADSMSMTQFQYWRYSIRLILFSMMNLYF